MQKAAPDIDVYISMFPAETATKLIELRELVRKVAPNATETISYAIPTFKLNGPLVHFAGYKGHIGFYPGAGGIEAFKDKLTAYKTSKGTVQFLLDRPLPAELITKIVKFRIKQNLEKKK